MRKEQKRNLIVTFIIAAVLLAVYVFLVQAELIPYDQNYYGAKVNGKAFLLVNRQRVNEILSEISKYIVDK